MPAASIVPLLAQFRSELADVEDDLRFAVMASTLRPRLGAMLNWSMMDAAARDLAQRFMGARQSDVAAIFRGLYVCIAACYENFVRQLVRAGAELAAASVQAFDELEDMLKHQNIYCTGRAFENVFGRRPHIQLDYYRLSGDIGTCVPGSREFRLNAEAFAIDVTTPTVDGLERVLGRIGIRDYWDDVGRHKGLQKVLGAGGVREGNSLAREFLNRFVERRNTIVHVGSSAVAVLENDINDAIAFFTKFSEALGEIVSVRASAGTS